jgi:demethylmenaquinone methyltransferase/2-methoxy-6-polyprenyl-1,4-benzoquinol methylase
LAVPDPRRNTISAPLPPAAPAAWSEADLADPHQHANKADKVRAMFGAIAPAYDLNNRLHSLGRDQSWRRRAVRAAQVKPGDTVLDIACGTGDLTELFARSPAASITGVDFTPAMLDIAREKLGRRPAGQRAKVTYEEGDAQNLRFADASADVISIAFGIRNVADPAAAVREFARILRPGGRLVILEFDTPRFPPARWLNSLYCGLVMPRTATLISRDRSGAYRYLPKSVGKFMSREAMCDLLARSGFRDVSAKPLTLGVCVCYRALKA